MSIKHINVKETGFIRTLEMRNKAIGVNVSLFRLKSSLSALLFQVGSTAFAQAANTVKMEVNPLPSYILIAVCATISGGLGGVAYWLRLLSEGKELTRRRLFGSIGIAVFCGMIVTALALSQTHSGPVVSIVFGSVMAFSGGHVFLKHLASLISTKLGGEVDSDKD